MDCTHVRTVRKISGHRTFSKLLRYHLQSSEAPGPFPIADIDVVGRLNAIGPGVLTKEVAETFHGQRIVGVILTPQFIGGIQVPGAGGGVWLKDDVSGGLHKLDGVVAVRNRRPHVLLGLFADGEAVVVGDQPPQALQRP